MSDGFAMTPEPVLRSAAVRAASRDLGQLAHGTLERAQGMVQVSVQLSVAAERLRSTVDELRAHALYDIGGLTGTHGVTLCGLLAGDEVSLVPELSWRDVEAPYRCDDCVDHASVPVSRAGG